MNRQVPHAAEDSNINQSDALLNGALFWPAMTKMTRSTGRRAEYAELTRQAIVAAARALFAERGYFATTVNDVAERARVAPATVYAVTGGKHGLVQTLLEHWTTAPIVAERAALIDAEPDPARVLRLAAGVVTDMRAGFGDIVALGRSVAPHDETVAGLMAAATRTYRAEVEAVARHLRDLGALNVDLATATDVLWFYLGYAGLTTLVEENGWDPARARDWLAAQAAAALGIATGTPRPAGR